MKISIVGAGLFGAVVVWSALPTSRTGRAQSEAGTRTTPERAPAHAAPVRAAAVHAATATDIPPEALTATVRRVCAVCHNDQLKTGNLSLQTFDVAQAAQQPEAAEKMIVKLRAGMMPPPGVPKPKGDTLQALVETLERIMDAAAAKDPNPGSRPFQRLNRVEYQASIKELLGLDVNAGAYLPLDTKSANFDNIADVQVLSPTLLDAFLNAAAEISWLAVGNPRATPLEVDYEKSGYNSQWDRVEGAPFGTRGGITTTHVFPADGKYVFKLAFDHTTTGGFFGSTARDETIEISIDGTPVATLAVDQWMDVSDPNHVNQETDPVFVRAGEHVVSAAFYQRSDGPMEDLVSPHEWSLTDRQIGAGGYGITALPHLKDLTIAGPYDPTGVSDTPSRRKIFTCRPTAAAEVRPCAETILGRLASSAFRRPATADDMALLMPFYDEGAARGGFEEGVRSGLQAILASPDFVFRVELPADANVPVGRNYRIGDLALASRLSFFLWGTPPDDELLGLAKQGRLGQPVVLEQQARRMLADPRSAALGSRFAAQWLRLQDLEKVHPDAFWYPDFDQQLADAMKQETITFFDNLVREDRSFLELLSADYTFVNERLARHYGIPNVVGSDFRRVSYPDDKRRGLLGQGSFLVLTSHANRTSPVLRGKWVMEVIMGTPPPPPPAGVPALDQTKGATGTRELTTRERMEMHRAAPVCQACHRFMDPMGLALDNFDVTGRWRTRENGVGLDTRGELYDGTPLNSADDLRQALLRRPVPIVRTFTRNLMAYALGRRAQWYDQPTIRAIAAQAEQDGWRMSSFILGVVKSDAFRMQRAEAATEETTTASHN